MTEQDKHDHAEYAVSTSIPCVDCGEHIEACAMCGKQLHNCQRVQDKRILPGYRVVEEFPDYMVNNQATVRHIDSQRYCMLVRVTKTNGALINLQKDGKKYTRVAQDLRDKAFGNAS